MAYCAKALVSAGYEVDVLTVEPEENHPVYWIDPNEAKLLDKSVVVHRIPMGIVNRLAARMALGGTRNPNSNGLSDATYVHGLGSKLYRSRSFWQPFAVPDASVDWLPGAVIKARSLLRRRGHDLVVTHGNPNTCHLVGYYSLGNRKVRLVSDYGDAWGTNSMLDHLPRWRKRIDQFLERRFLKRVDIVTTSSEGIARELQLQYGLDCERTFVVPSSFVDIDEYKAIRPLHCPQFTITYTGNIHHGIQDPSAFFEAIKRFTANELRVSFAGQVNGSLASFDGSTNPQGVIDLKGCLGRAEVMQLQRNASVLLLFGIRGAIQIPAKLYEYFAAQRPILCVAEKQDDPAAVLVKKHHRGVIVSNGVEEISSGLRKLLDLHTTGHLDSAFSLEELPDYSFKGATEKFLRGVLS